MYFEINRDKVGRLTQMLTDGRIPNVHVLSLLGPLHPHADAVLEEGRDEAEAGEVRQDVLPVPRDLHKVKREVSIRFSNHFGLFINLKNERSIKTIKTLS